jgi:hypothetical protein
MVKNASKYINRNDYLGKLSILDATNQGLNKNFMVKANFINE